MALYRVIKIKPQIPHCVAILQFSTKLAREQEYKKCYKILEIPEDSDQEEIRRAYLTMVKRYHPDSCTNEANADRFQQIDKAFRLLMDKKSKERWNVDDTIEDAEEQDIIHTAPQHRQYLSYGGIGSGNPFQRQKQYTKTRAMQASENVLKHRLAKAVADEKSLMAKTSYKHKIKTKYGFDRLVEDLIQEAISKGKFDNLSGYGKPLAEVSSKNPYVDYVTYKLNEILIENGFTPEWITLQKEIREDIQVFRNTLQLERINFPPYPLTIEENIKWSDAVYKHKDMVVQLNKKINKYNLLVPILQRQMLFVSLQKEAQNVLLKGKSSKDVINGNHPRKDATDTEKGTTEEPLNLLEYLKQIIRKLNMIEIIISDLKNEIRDIKTNKPNEEIVENIWKNFNLPLLSENELLQFEQFLGDPLNMQKSVDLLSKVGGNNVEEFVKRALIRLLTNQVQMEYSWLGLKHKKNFSALMMATLIKGAAFKLLPNSCTEKKVEDFFKRYLKRAPERAKYEDRRRN